MNFVAIPNVPPPPPLNAQKISEFEDVFFVPSGYVMNVEVLSATIILPSAVTISTSNKLSTPNPETPDIGLWPKTK